MMIDSYRVNTVGPMLVTQAFYSFLKSSKVPKVINISSSLGSLKLARSGSISYRASKTALNMRKFVFLPRKSDETTQETRWLRMIHLGTMKPVHCWVVMIISLVNFPEPGVVWPRYELWYSGLTQSQWWGQKCKSQKLDSDTVANCCLFVVFFVRIKIETLLVSDTWNLSAWQKTTKIMSGCQKRPW